ncbi:MAG: hypothetical protein IT452_20750 [Planctomycetia bacterium]|nr:hypothetical protein [Planctomycetia bacterium]
MYTRFAEKLVVTTTGSPEFSFAIPMGDANAIQVELTIFAVVASATLTFEVQGSNDMQNWTGSVLAPVASLGVGYQSGSSFKATGIAFQYIRFKYTSVGASGSVILAAGVNTAKL